MGEAADDMWDRAFQADSDYSMMIKNIRGSCGDDCVIVTAPDDIEDEDWLPYMCVTCKQRFDFP